jgi:Aldehyde dehydrogenase family
MGQFDRITFDGELYRLDGCGEVRLRARRGQRQAHAMHGRSENHGVILPDADLDQVVADVLAGAFGSSGERCICSRVAGGMPYNTPLCRKREFLDL